MHHKRRKRRRSGIKGCCGMCALQWGNGKRNGRRLTLAERRQQLTLAEGLAEVTTVIVRR